MSSIASSSPVVTGGVDTHKDLHVAAVLDTAGTVLDTGSFSTTRAGFRALLRWMRKHGDLRLGRVPPAEAEAEYYAHHHAGQPADHTK